MNRSEQSEELRAITDALPGRAPYDPLLDDLVDRVVPSEIEWRPLLVKHPRLAVLATAATGFWIGRSRGLSIFAAASGFVAGELAKRLGDDD
ncbi:MAG: hypothetical protein AAGN46_03190 [Acidobacteriota bacterium]